jgi:phosphohistidine swiveling domain-containing protein
MRKDSRLGNLVATAPESIPQASEGVILVVQQATPELGSAIPFLAGLIAERGHPTSHAATLLREFAVPSLFEVPGATAKIASGVMIGLDASRRQLFVPLQLLQSHGSSIEEVFAAKETPKLRAALDQLIQEAGSHLKTACALLENMPPQVRPIFLPLALVARDLQRLSRADNDPFVPRVTSRLRTLWTLWWASRSRVFGG